MLYIPFMSHMSVFFLGVIALCWSVSWWKPKAGTHLGHLITWSTHMLRMVFIQVSDVELPLHLTGCFSEVRENKTSGREDVQSCSQTSPPGHLHTAIC